MAGVTFAESCQGEQVCSTGVSGEQPRPSAIMLCVRFRKTAIHRIDERPIAGIQTGASASRLTRKSPRKKSVLTRVIAP
jgi:hypothetical protein